jgi:chemotaxis response regulator CheB
LPSIAFGAAERAIAPEISGRDIVVVGGSAGGLSPLECLLPGLPADLPVAIFSVRHVGTDSRLAEILARISALPVGQAENSQQIEIGRASVGVPERHTWEPTGATAPGPPQIRLETAIAAQELFDMDIENRLATLPRFPACHGGAGGGR